VDPLLELLLLEGTFREQDDVGASSSLRLEIAVPAAIQPVFLPIASITFTVSVV